MVARAVRRHHFCPCVYRPQRGDARSVTHTQEAGSAEAESPRAQEEERCRERLRTGEPQVEWDGDVVGRLQLPDQRPQAVENFRHMGYPQQLRILLGIGKLAGAIVLLLPRLPTLKEWAYAGFTFMWIAATVAHYLAADGIFLLPVALIGILGLSYVTRPANRRNSAKAMLA